MKILRIDWRIKSEQNWLCRSSFKCLQYAYTGYKKFQICVYVCVCVCMCVYVYIYIYIYIYIYVICITIYNFIYRSINNLKHTRLFHVRMVTHYILGTYNIRYALELITNILPAFYILIMLKHCILHLCNGSQTYVVSPYIHLL